MATIFSSFEAPGKRSGETRMKLGGLFSLSQPSHKGFTPNPLNRPDLDDRRSFPRCGQLLPTAAADLHCCDCLSNRQKLILGVLHPVFTIPRGRRKL